MGFFQNLKDDLTSTIDDIANKEEQETAPSDTQSLLDILKSDEFIAAINDDNDAEDDGNNDIEEVIKAIEDKVNEEETEEETEERITENIEEVDSEEALEGAEDVVDVLAEASLDDTLGDIMDSAEEATKESTVRDALNSLRNASIRYEQQQNEINKTESIDITDVDNENDTEIEFEENIDDRAEEVKEMGEEAVAQTEEISISPVIDEPYQGISEEVAVIAKGMVISGDVVSDGNIELLGTINGNITIAGKLSVSGKVKGNIKADDMFVNGAELEGNIETTTSVKVGNGSVIIGDIKSSAAIIAGAVKGDIDVHGPVILDSSAIIMGNIKSMSVQINNGAVVEGMCSQCYADVNPTDFFKEFKK